MLLHHLEEHLLHEHGVGRSSARTRPRVLVHLRLELSRGTTLLTKLNSFISCAVNGRPVNTISWNLRSPIIIAHCHCAALPDIAERRMAEHASSDQITMSASAA